MNFNNPGKSDSTIVTRTVCAIVFMAFTFCWLYFFQADMLAVTQYVLSGGQTAYDRTVGAVLITLTLQMTQLAVYALTGLSKRFHAITYLPSLLLLALLTDITPVASPPALHLSTFWWWAAPLLLLLWIGVVRMARTFQPYEDDRTGWFLSRRVWVNLLTMSLLVLGVTLTANTNAVMHFRAHAETAILQGDIDEALRVGQNSHETDASLTMLRAYALSRKGELGHRLFHYPVAGTGTDLLPLSGNGTPGTQGRQPEQGQPPVGNHSALLLIPADTIFRHLGAKPRNGMDTRRYLRNLTVGGQATDAVADYVLCAHLIDRDLDAFAADITEYYSLADSTAELPRHYREALVLYTHLRAHPRLVYHDTVMDEDYEDLQQLEAQYPELSARKNQVRERYHNSYWYYYEYSR